MSIHRLIALSLVGSLTLLSVACSKPEQAEAPAAASSTNTGYVSENQQFVDQLDKEVELENPDKLLAELDQPESPKQ